MTRLLLICACATSAGIHAALTPGHLADSRTLGLSFAAAAVALAAVALALVLRPTPAVALAAGSLHATLILAYVATRVAEPVDALGLATKAVETLGLVLAVSVAHGNGGRTRHRAASVALALVVAAVAAVVTPAATHAHAPGVPARAHGH